MIKTICWHTLFNLNPTYMASALNKLWLNRKTTYIYNADATLESPKLCAVNHSSTKVYVTRFEVIKANLNND